MRSFLACALDVSHAVAGVTTMLQVVFICLGNICRSPLAEVVFSNTLNSKSHNLSIVVGSAATSAYEIGNPADERAQQVALHRNLHSIKLHRARRLHRDLFLPEATEILLICMDNENRTDTQALLQNNPELLRKCQLYLFSDFGPDAGSEVADPYYGNLKDFQEVLVQCERYSQELISHLDNKKS